MQVNLTRLFYIIGGLFLFAGLGLLIQQIWVDLNTPLRILITFGLGVVLTLIGVYLLRMKYDVFGNVLQAMGGVFVISGVFVTMNELRVPEETLFLSTAIAFVFMSLFYFVLYKVQTSNLVMFFTILCATIASHLFLSHFLVDRPYEDVVDYTAHLYIVIGFAYWGLVEAFGSIWNRCLTAGLLFFGSTFIFLFAWTLLFDSTLWEVFYVILIAFGFVFATHVKSKIVLVFSSISLVAYLSYIATQYFVDSVGWPVALMIMGVLIMAVGFFAVSIYQKFIIKKG